MKSIVVFWCFCIVGICYVYAIDSNRVDSLLLKLDQSIKKRPIYMEQKELRLAKLRRQLLQLISEEEHFAILGALLDEYRSFNTDSAFYVAEEREQIAMRLGNREYIDNARMNKADVLGMTGMYKEAMDLIFMQNGCRKTSVPIIIISIAQSMDLWLTMQLQSMKGNFIRNLRTNIVIHCY